MAGRHGARRTAPACLALSRQGLPDPRPLRVRARRGPGARRLRPGRQAEGYAGSHRHGRGAPRCTTRCAARATLQGTTASRVRVVSMPCWELFDPAGPGLPATRCCRRRSRPASRRGRGHLRLAEFVGAAGKSVGLDRFGASGVWQDGRCASSASRPEAPSAAAVREVTGRADLLARLGAARRTRRRRWRSSRAPTPPAACSRATEDSGPTTPSGRPRSRAGSAGCRWWRRWPGGPAS